ncbi:MAG: hypothetical protein HFI81_06390 [Eubacterium sp.]|nr:hypothetical protein [Eubacterium sp.]
MQKKHIGFRLWYLSKTFFMWLLHGGPFNKRLISWDLWMEDVRIDYQEGTFKEFVKWIISGEIFKKLEKES